MLVNLSGFRIIAMMCEVPPRPFFHLDQSFVACCEAGVIIGWRILLGRSWPVAKMQGLKHWNVSLWRPNFERRSELAMRKGLVQPRNLVGPIHLVELRQAK